MVESYPLVPLWQTHGIGVALFSYAGTVYWGLNADYDIVPDVDAFAASLEVAFDELYAAAMASGVDTSKPKRPRKRPPLGKTAAAETATKPTATKTAKPKTAKKKKPATNKSATAKDTEPKKTAAAKEG